MSGNRREPPEGYLSILDVVKQLKKKDLKVNQSSLKYRFDKGKISGIRDLEDIRKRRLVLIDELPYITGYYDELEKIKCKKRSLCDLARDVEISEKNLYRIAQKEHINTRRVGNREVLSEREYCKWKIILQKRKRINKDYITTGDLGRGWGKNHYSILYYIKTGKIPAKKMRGKYLIPRSGFEEHSEEWKKDCGL